MPPIVNNCVFCGASPTTKEHVYSRWTHKFITKMPGRYLSTQGTESKTSSDLKLLKGKGDIHDWQVKCVDEGCNSGWMSQLEKRAMPILTPLLKSEATVLSVTDQRTVAAWAVLKAMVGESETGMVSWSFGERDRMQRLRLPPNRDCAVWIARINRGAWKPQWLCFSFPDFGRRYGSIAPHRAAIEAPHQRKSSAIYSFTSSMVRFCACSKRSIARPSTTMLSGLSGQSAT